MNDILLNIPELTEKGIPFVLCMVTRAEGSTPQKAGARMLVLPDGRIIGTIGGGAIELHAVEYAAEMMETTKPVIKNFQLCDDLQMQCGGKMEIYFEPFGRPLRLYIFGAGHIGRALGKYANEMGFKVTYVDNRGGVFDSFDPAYAECVSCDYDESVDKIAFNDRDFVVLTTHKHEYDESLLEKLATKKLAYLGMIGSKRKVAAVRRRMIDEKKLTESQLEKVNMPIGMPFRAIKPEEIAISIIAKIIDVKNTINL